MPKAIKVIGMFVQDMSTLVHALTMNDNTARTMGYVQTACDGCGAQCWLGPAQQLEYEKTKGDVALMCYGCVLFGQRVVFHTRPDALPTEKGKEA